MSLAEGDAVRPLTIDLGDDSPYPPVVALENVIPLRRWFAKNLTAACSIFGTHEMCAGVCALGSEVVPERMCLCPCHLEAR